MAKEKDVSDSSFDNSKYSIENFRRLDKEIDSLYTNSIKKSGISHSEFWILLMVYEGVKNQKEICEQLFWSKQTVNSACAKLQNRGFITLEFSEKNKKEKEIVLTKEGKTFSNRYVKSLYDAEDFIWERFSQDEKTAIIKLLSKYSTLLREFTKDI
ncbi:MAG: winged helix-turn-helix transcriptional regulator [Spirochaetaceae bacterium]|nr:winged helix-turn-helix transcriptional regulator [Spirochaetaceae bacterium]